MPITKRSGQPRIFRKMRSTLFIVRILSISILSGCAVAILPPDTRPAPALRPVVAHAETNNNNVTILRNADIGYYRERYWPTLAGKNLAGLLTKQHISFTLKPGDHRLGVKCYLRHGPSGTEFSVQEIDITLTKNESRYFVLGKPFISCASIKEIKQSVAEEFLKKSIRIKTGLVSNCQGKPVPLEAIKRAECPIRLFPF